MILALVEHADGRPERLSLEMLTLAGRLAGASGEPLEAVLLGAGARRLPPASSPDAASRSPIVVEDERLAAFAPVAWAASIGQLVVGQRRVGRPRGRQRPRQRGDGPPRPPRTELPMAANCHRGRAGRAVPAHPPALGRQPPRGCRARCPDRSS